MKLTKTLLVATALLASGASQADFVGINAGIERWNYDIDGTFYSTNRAFNTNKDLNFPNSKSDNTYYLAFEHSFPYLPNIKVQKTKAISGTSTGNGLIPITTDTYFGLTLESGDSIGIEYDISHIDYTLYYEVVDSWLSLDLGLAVKKFDDGPIKFDIYSPHNDEAEYDMPWLYPEYVEFTEDFVEKTIPAVYSKIQFDLPFTGFNTGMIMTIGKESNAKISDVKAYLNYQADSGIGIELGYRTLTLEQDIIENDILRLPSDTTTDGYYLGLTLEL